MNMPKFNYQKILIPCPFCDKEMTVFHKPELATTRTSRVSAGAKQSNFVEREKYQSADCPHCGTTGTKIEKALLDASSMYGHKIKSKGELRKQLEELGLMKKFGGEK